MPSIAKLKNQLKIYNHKWSPHYSVLFFVGGFLFDLLTLGRIDDTLNLLSQFFYLTVCLFFLTAELLPEETPYKFFHYKRKWHPEAIQFCLGALLSAYTIFYFKSASLSNSLLFILFIITLLIINELKLIQILDYFLRMTLFHICLVTFLFILIPLMTGTLSSGDFALGIALTFIVYLSVLTFYKKIGIKREIILKKFLYPGAFIIVFFNLSYMFNLLPPLPLAIKNISVFHEIVKKEGQYIGIGQYPSWQFWRQGDTPFLADPNEKPYIFISVFAPKGFNGRIIMHWQIYKDNKWQTSDRIPLLIKGGREEGFRGFSYKEKWVPGEWRILVETEDKREIGRLKFDIREDLENKQSTESYQL